MTDRKIQAEARLYKLFRGAQESLTDQEKTILSALETINGVKEAADAPRGKSMNRADLNAAVAAIKAVDTFALDLETQSTTKNKADATNPRRNRIEGVALAIGMRPSESWWFPFLNVPAEETFSQVEVFRALDPILKDPSKFIVGSNTKFDLECLKVQGVDVKNRIIDTVVSDWLVDENLKRHGLKELVERYFKIKLEKYGEAKAVKEGIAEDDRKRFAEYATNDARYVLKVWKEIHLKELSKDPKCKDDPKTMPRLLRLFHEVEMEIVEILVEAELMGVRIDMVYLDALEKRMTDEAEQAKQAAIKIYGQEFDIGSPTVVSEILFGIPSDEALADVVAEKAFKTGKSAKDILAKMTDRGNLFGGAPKGLLPLPVDMKGALLPPGKNGLYSTDDEILGKLKGAHPIVEKILDHRWATKTKNTYVTSYRELIEEDGRVHPDFKQAGTIAFRFACKRPNLQQIPKEKGLVKPMFIPADGHSFVCGDFNQLQFRLIGHFAKRVLKKSVIHEAYLAGKDLHTKTKDDMKLPDRTAAKVVNFAFLFGRGADSLSEKDNIPFPMAKGYYEGFHKNYPEVKKMAMWARQCICDQGYIESLTGRRRRFMQHKGKDQFRRREKGEKDDGLWWDGWKAWNSVIQMAESDLVRISMRNIFREIKERRKTDSRWNTVKILIQIHDELVIEAPTEIVEEVAKMAKEKAETALSLEVPIIFEVGVSSENWEAAKK
jgi:DNA polymerase-1